MDKEKEISVYEKIREGYNRAGQEFSCTRSYFWSDLAFIKDYVRENDKLLDFGCGNGRLIGLLRGKKIAYRGIDCSEKLIALAEKKYGGRGGRAFSGFAECTFKTIDPTEFKLPKQKYNALVSIGVFHHFPPGEQRLRIAEKLVGALKNEGTMIISAWDLNQPKYTRYFRQEKNRKAKEAYIPFKNSSGAVVFDRYCYRWKLEELAIFFAQAGLKISSCFATRRKGKPANLCIIGKKTG